MSNVVTDEKGCIRRVLVAMMVADGDVDPDELVAIRTVYAEMTGETITAAQLQSDAKQVLGQDGGVAACLVDLGKGLGIKGRRRVFEAAFAVAGADGFVLEEEERMLANVAAALGFTEAQFRAEVDRLMS